MLGFAALAAVARTSNLSRAGEQLGVSGSAISKQLTRLERSLGVKLIRRTTRSVTLSPAGEQLAAEFERARTILDDVVDDIRAEGSGPRGLLKVSFPPAFALSVLPGLLKRFSCLYPEVILDLDLTGRLVNVHDEGFDVAVRVTSSPSHDYVVVELGRVHWGIYGSIEYLSIAGKPKSMDDLKHHRFITSESRSGNSRIEFVGPGGESNVSVTPVMTTASVEATHALVLEGLGLGILPHFLFSQERGMTVVEHVLRQFSVVGARGNRLFALMLPGRSMRPAAKVFVDFLRAELADLPRSPVAGKPGRKTGR